jgi:mono/diheme cytochrome c family protein
MWATNLKVLATMLVVVGFYTAVAHVIPQLESEVPETLALTGAVTAEQLTGAGERIYNGAGGCAACHGLGTRAPNLLTDHAGQGQIGARCGARKPGADCKAYLYESMTTPGAFIVPGFDNIMPDMRRQLSNDQIWAVVAYLESQGGEVTVTGEDIARTGGAPASGGAAAPAAATAAAASTDPGEIIKASGCTGCHQLGGAGAPIGPPFDGMGTRLTADRIRRAILLPNADTARGYEKFAGTMPTTFGQQLTAAQLEAVVEFLASRK